MKKGFIAIVLVLAMALCFTAFAACMPDSPSEGNPSGGGSITAPEDPGGDSGSTGGDTDGPGTGGNTDDNGEFTEEDAVRALLRGLTSDFTSGSATLSSYGYFNNYATTMTFDATAEDGRLLALCRGAGERGDDRESRDGAIAAAVASALASEDVSYYTDGRMWYNGEWSDGYNYKFGNIFDDLFGGGLIGELENRLGTDIFSDWTFDDLRGMIEDIPVEGINRLIKLLYWDYSDFAAYFNYQLSLAYLISDIVADTAIGDMTLGELLDGLNSTLSAIGFGYAVDEIVANLIGDAIGDTVRTELTPDESGYTLTIASDGLTEAANNLADRMRGYYNGTVDEAIKGLLGIDAAAAFDSVTSVLTGSFTVEETVQLAENAFSDFGVTRDTVCTIISRIANVYYRDSIDAEEIMNDYLPMTLDEFIGELTGGNYDYASYVGRLEEQMNRYLPMKVSEALAEADPDNAEVFGKILGSLDCDTLEFSVEATFDGDGVLTGADAYIDMMFTFTDVATDEETLEGSYYTMSISGLGTTTVELPEDVTLPYAA